MRLYYNLYPRSPCFSPIKLYIINTPITSKFTLPLKSFFPPSQACRMMTSSLQHAKSNFIQLNFVLTLLLSHWPKTLLALTYMSFLPPRHALGISSTKCAALCGDRSALWQAQGRAPSWAQGQGREQVWVVQGLGGGVGIGARGVVCSIVGI